MKEKHHPIQSTISSEYNSKKIIVQFIHTKIFSFSRNNSEQNLIIIRLWEISNYNREKPNQGVY